ncbi:uncharacterized protein N7506_007208 [Penicillium brevicompactum]|uniref:uncharacterized protein n=1 Tax=Penicillium brevicompactum TaxID=5074 RepID=UPI00253F9D18|nr:uncharacterized protein N7506_007208 [Penicillium brevicompactum]KAJ5333425.1 hypothetical protein N7506_007208 [Penicillium brevicompactum]
MICQSKFLRLYFPGRDFQKTQLDQLKNFLGALRDRKLQTKAFDHARHGLVQKDQRASSPSLDPPPYSGHPASVQAGGDPPTPIFRDVRVSESGWKTAQRYDSITPSPSPLSLGGLSIYIGPLSVPSDDERQKRLLPSYSQSRGSSTEPTTPSTLSPSRSIRPTCFEHPRSPSHIEPAKLTRLLHELDGVPDDLIRELLIRSGRQHLLAKPEKTPSDLPCELENTSPTHVAMIEHRLTQYLDRKIEQRFNNIVDGVVDECRDQVYDECKTNEAEFREQVDDANSEVRNTANDCMGEVKEEAQKYMRELEEKAHQYMNSIEDQGVEVKMCLEESVFNLKSRFDTSAQTTLGRKSGLSHELGTNARRLSI